MTEAGAKTWNFDEYERFWNERKDVLLRELDSGE